MVGAGAGSLAGPGGAGLGAGAGYGAGVALTATTGNSDAAQAIAETVEGVSAADIRSLIEVSMGEQRGFFDGIVDEIYGLLKMLMLISIVAFGGHFLWTWKRKKRGEAFYTELEALKGKLK